MSKAREEFHSAAGDNAKRASQQGICALFMTTVWFGLLAGWLELGLVLARAAIDPHVSVDTLRTNRHFVWMLPVSDVLIFSVVGLLIAGLATFQRRLARWTALRLPVAMSFLSLLLNIEGLHVIAGVILACGLGSIIGRRLERRATGFGRLVRVSLPAMAVSLVVLTGLTYERVNRLNTARSRSAPPRSLVLPTCC